MNTLLLDQVEQNFESWRAGKKYKGERLPAELKAQVIALAGKHTKTELLYRLSLSSSQLKKILSKEAGKKKLSNAPSFVRLNSSQQITSQVELCFPSGLIVKISP